MSEKATIIRRLEAAIAHALDELERAEEKSKHWDPYDGVDVEAIHLEGHVAGLKQALNLVREAI